MDPTPKATVARPDWVYVALLVFVAAAIIITPFPHRNALGSSG
jgi:hypothetical protein